MTRLTGRFAAGAATAVLVATTATAPAPEPTSGDPAPRPRAARPDTAPRRGALFVVGGGERPASLMRRFVRLAGGPDSSRIVVIPMASSSPEETGRRHAEELRTLGAAVESLPLDRRRADSDRAVAAVRRVTGVWFPGGVQSRLADTLRGTAVLEAIERRYRSGAVVGGTSAGAAVMSDSMITGDQVRPGSDTAGYYGDEFPRIARDYIVLEPGFGLLPGAIVDQHFLRRERHNRLISAVLDNPRLIGAGIDESTALIVRSDGTWEVAGRSSVLVVDAGGARVTPPGHDVLGAADLSLHVLPPGGTYDPRSGTARLPGTRDTVPLR